MFNFGYGVTIGNLPAQKKVRVKKIGHGRLNDWRTNQTNKIE